MNNQYFPHEKLDVYSKCLAFSRKTSSLIDHWPTTAAVRDQLDRASESHITNLVRAVQNHGTPKGIYFLECSLGSVLECAACLDVGAVKHLSYRYSFSGCIYEHRTVPAADSVTLGNGKCRKHRAMFDKCLSGNRINPLG